MLARPPLIVGFSLLPPSGLETFLLGTSYVNKYVFFVLLKFRLVFLLIKNGKKNTLLLIFKFSLFLLFNIRHKDFHPFVQSVLPLCHLRVDLIYYLGIKPGSEPVTKKMFKKNLTGWRRKRGKRGDESSNLLLSYSLWQGK